MALSARSVPAVTFSAALAPRPWLGCAGPLRPQVREGEDSGTFKYFLKLVPTAMFHAGARHPQHTHQYSVTEYFSPAAVAGGEVSVPAIYFVYDFSPITVNIRERRRSGLHFLTRVCAVVGGVFAVTGIVDRWVQWLMKLLRPLL